jgi:hypothetical protein
MEFHTYGFFNCTGFLICYGFALFVYKKKNQEYVYHTQSAGNRTTSIYKVLINSTNTNSHKLYQIQIPEATFLAGLRLKIQQLNIDIEPHNTRKRKKKVWINTKEILLSQHFSGKKSEDKSVNELCILVSSDEPKNYI